MFLKDRLNLANTERTYTDEGFLIVPARISRVGTQQYFAAEMGLTDREPTDPVIVYRPEAEVFSDESLQSFSSKPITDNHPPELVNSRNAKEFSVGHAAREITKDGNFVKTILHVIDADAISKIESGKVELSNGYTADIDWTPGISPEGETYDAVQRNIKGNHIAIVERGRAGPACRLADNLTIDNEVTKMPKITIDGVDYEVSDQAAQAVNKLKASLKDAEEKTLSAEEMKKLKEDELEEKAKDSKSAEDSLKAKLDDALSKIPTAEDLDKLVADRQAVVADAIKIHPELEWEGKDALTIRKEVVAAVCPTVQMDSVSDDYINARFDILLESAGSRDHNHMDAAIKKLTVVSDTTVDERPADVISREKMMVDSQNAWKGGAK